MDSEELADLSVEYVNKSSTHRLNEYIITVKFWLNDTVASFLEHLSASYNGLRSCSSGKELHLLTSNGEMKRLDQHKHSTLKSLGVRNNDHLELRGFRPISRQHYVYPLKVIDPDGKPIHVYVTNTTNINSLKRKLQNETGIHATEITLQCNGKILPKSSSRTVEFYGKKTLRMKHSMKQPTVQALPRNNGIGSSVGSKSLQYGQLISCLVSPNNLHASHNYANIQEYSLHGMM